jgi:glycerol-3-phosphate dehydrogenase
MKRMPEALTEEAFDLLILGGGITGAGVALDAALRGLRVALIDKGDFASGTSSRSSKLIHGGLRYLEHNDFHLVYEALQERARLLNNAPHLVHPLRFVIPFYTGARISSWKFRAGLVLYDLLAGAGNIRRSRTITLPQLRREFPTLQAAELRGGAEYCDAQMDDARLCLEVLRTAALHGAIVVNYVEAIAFHFSNGVLRGVQAVDHLSGRELSIAAKQVLNATGPWADVVRRLAGDDGKPLLRPTKGVHLILPDRGLSAAFLLLHPADGRVFFVLPFGNKTLLGTTDTVWDNSPDKLSVTSEDVEYLLTGFNHYFAPLLSATAVLNSFAGLRPLIDTRPGQPSDLSREFQLYVSPSGLLTAAGGKYTTYRRMAEIITDTVVRRLGLRRRCRTRCFRLDGTPQQPWQSFRASTIRTLTSACQLSKETAAHLVDRYGRRALEVADYLQRDPALGQRVVEDEPDIFAEFAYQRDHEMALTPADFLLRRTHLGLFHPELLSNPPTLCEQCSAEKKTAR